MVHSRENMRKSPQDRRAPKIKSENRKGLGIGLSFDIVAVNLKTGFQIYDPLKMMQIMKAVPLRDTGRILVCLYFCLLSKLRKIWGSTMEGRWKRSAF